MTQAGKARRRRRTIERQIKDPKFAKIHRDNLLRQAKAEGRLSPDAPTPESAGQELADAAAQQRQTTSRAANILTGRTGLSTPLGIEEDEDDDSILGLASRTLAGA